MIDARQPEYVLTIVQHTYCADCMWVKGNNRHTNIQIEKQLVDFVKEWKGQPAPDVCAIGG